MEEVGVGIGGERGYGWKGGLGVEKREGVRKVGEGVWVEGVDEWEKG